MNKRTALLTLELIKQPGVNAYECSSSPYIRTSKTVITNVYEKENRHPKMPKNYVTVIIPTDEFGTPL